MKAQGLSVHFLDKENFWHQPIYTFPSSPHTNTFCLLAVGDQHFQFVHKSVCPTSCSSADHLWKTLCWRTPQPQPCLLTVKVWFSFCKPSAGNLKSAFQPSHQLGCLCLILDIAQARIFLPPKKKKTASLGPQIDSQIQMGPFSLLLLKFLGLMVAFF